MAKAFNPIINQPKLSEYNVKIKDLEYNLYDAIKKKDVKPAIKKYIDIFEQSTSASNTTEQETYKPPQFNDDIIDNLECEKDIIYNTNYKQETCLQMRYFISNGTTKIQKLKCMRMDINHRIINIYNN